MVPIVVTNSSKDLMKLEMKWKEKSDLGRRWKTFKFPKFFHPKKKSRRKKWKHHHQPVKLTFLLVYVLRNCLRFHKLDQKTKLPQIYTTNNTSPRYLVQSRIEGLYNLNLRLQNILPWKHAKYFVCRIRNEGTFEVVSHSKSNSLKHTEQARLSANQGPKLTLGNRYDTLSNS